MQVVWDGKTHQVSGKVGGMIQYLVRKQEQINEAQNVRVEFNCAGRKVKPRLEIFEGEVTVES